MKKILLLISLACIMQVNAQVCLGTPTSFTVGDQSLVIISTDFNGDGFADLATANWQSNNVSVLLGIGNGSFNPVTNYAVDSMPTTIVSADFNGDGKKDLAVTTVGSGSDFSVLLGVGNGTFNPATNFSVSIGSFVSADFNSDGFADLAGTGGTGGIQVLLGNGTGNFGAAIPFTAGNNPYTLITADFNGDGLADLAATNYNSNNISVLLGTGTGSFSPANDFLSGSSSYSALTSGDFNGDSKTDIATANWSSNNISVLLGTGTGSFGAPVHFAAGTSPDGITSADFNSDGKTDLAVTNYNSNNVKIFLGNGAGSFTSSSFAAGIHPEYSVGADFDGDGKTDLAVANDQNNISVLLNCTPTSTCVASVTDSLFNISPLNWGVVPQYSSQVTSAIWHWGDGTSTNGLYPSHTYTTSGWYNICVTVYTSCGDSASTCRNDTLYKMSNNNSMVNINIMASANGINQITSTSNQVTVYPNPTSDQFFIDANTTDKLTVDMYDVNGRHVFSTSVMDKSNINVATLDNGIYTLTIRTTGQVTNKKLVIAR